MLKNLFLLGLLSTSSALFAINCANYPHWTNCNDPNLIKIDAFIQSDANHGHVAVFDWDGTLFEENMPVDFGTYEVGVKFAGQPLFFMWGSQQNNPNYFPAFDTADGLKTLNVYRQNDYMEGKTNVVEDDYSKFAQTALFETGMTPGQISEAVGQFFDSENMMGKNYPYLPMFDVMQAFVNAGYQVYIVSGSNPYYVINMLAKVTAEAGYKGLLPSGCDPANPDLDVCHVVGNAGKLGTDGTFKMVYDDRFTKRPNATGDYFEHNIVDSVGKAIAIQNYVIANAHSVPVFYAGNSGGDYEAIAYILGQPNLNTFSIAVNPRGTLLDEVAEYVPQGKMVQVSMSPN